MDRSDTRQQIKNKLGAANMKGDDPKPPTSRREAADPIDPSDINEDQEETGPAHKVELGRKEPRGMTPRASGSIIGTGEDSEMDAGSAKGAMTSSNADKEPMAGGSTMGHKDAFHGMKGPKSFGRG